MFSTWYLLFISCFSVCAFLFIFFFLVLFFFFCFFFFSSRRRHTRCLSDWSSDVCSSDLERRAPHRLRQARQAVACEIVEIDQRGFGDGHVDPGIAGGREQHGGPSERDPERAHAGDLRSEERRVGKEGRYARWAGQ